LKSNLQMIVELTDFIMTTSLVYLSKNEDNIFELNDINIIISSHISSILNLLKIIKDSDTSTKPIVDAVINKVVNFSKTFELVETFELKNNNRKLQ